jgi:DNA-binding MarR family transcriptional regulator
MERQCNLRVRIEYGEAKADFEGNVDQVFESILRFLTEIHPNLAILQKIVYTPNLTRLAEELAGLVEITSAGPILVSELDLPAKQAACIALLGAYAGNKLGKTPKSALSPTELARVTGKARKTISNEMPRLIYEGLVERTTEREYQITILGIRKTEDIICELRST